MTVGQTIKHYRKLLGLTQKQLGLRCGFANTNADIRINQYENGVRHPKIHTKQKIAKALNIDVSLLREYIVSDDQLNQMISDIYSLDWFTTDNVQADDVVKIINEHLQQKGNK